MRHRELPAVVSPWLCYAFGGVFVLPSKLQVPLIGESAASLSQAHANEAQNLTFACVACSGILVALPCAFILKRFQVPPGEQQSQDRPHKDLAFSGTVYEIALVVMSAYMAYLTAEACPPVL